MQGDKVAHALKSLEFPAYLFLIKLLYPQRDYSKKTVTHKDFGSYFNLCRDGCVQSVNKHEKEVISQIPQEQNSIHPGNTRM